MNIKELKSILKENNINFYTYWENFYTYWDKKKVSLLSK